MTLSYGTAENRRNTVNLRGPFSTEDDPTRYNARVGAVWGGGHIQTFPERTGQKYTCFVYIMVLFPAGEQNKDENKLLVFPGMKVLVFLFLPFFQSPKSPFFYLPMC